MIETRPATDTDAEGMSDILAPILVGWRSSRQGDPATVLTRYIRDPDRIACTVALDSEGRIVGFQSLKRAADDNVYDLPTGWGIIGTYVMPGRSGLGIGRSLFEVSHAAAIAARLPAIDATIGGENTGAQAYYRAMGFVPYRTLPSGAVGACLRLGQSR